MRSIHRFAVLLEKISVRAQVVRKNIARILTVYNMKQKAEARKMYKGLAKRVQRGNPLLMLG